MNRFAYRSSQTELIDEAGVPFADWANCLRELNTINTLLGGHRITVSGMQQLIGAGRASITVAEVGCGGGDNLKAIHRWNRGRYPLRYCGVDLNAACIEFASDQCRELPGIRLICSDYREVDFGDHKPDILFSSLFCHHFDHDQLVGMLAWLKGQCTTGFFINDLQRHPFAYHSIKWLTRLFSRSYLIKNDAPISVTRGFTRKEWKQLLEQAGIKHYSIRWKWAFRYLVVVAHD